jgi:hypothetical protein
MLPSAGQGQRRIWLVDIICQLLLLIILCYLKHIGFAFLMLVIPICLGFGVGRSNLRENA